LQPNTSISADSKVSLYYKPKKRIELVEHLQIILKDQLKAFDNYSNPDLQKTFGMKCDERGQAVILIRTMKKLELNEDNAKALLHRLESESLYPLSCSAWMDTLLKLYPEKNQKAENRFLESEQSLQALLSENVSWNYEIPCLYSRHLGGLHVVSGTPQKCSDADSTNKSLFKSKSNTQYFTETLSRSFLQNAGNKISANIRGQSLLLTLDPEIQSLLDEWKKCFGATECKIKTTHRPLKHISVVVSDVQTGEILGSMCFGGPCNSPSLKNWGDLAALMVEVPPASTIKLLHALALAHHPETDTLMLQRQIKSSGQTDTSVTKRNEWWEKQAICDGSDQAKHCAHPKEVAKIAQKLGWNQHCQEKSIQCGRQNLIAGSEDLLMPGLIGRFDTGAEANQAVPMIDWKTYNAIRSNLQKTDGSRQYLNTSNAVQSVIGAGNARISPLGLAQLTMQIKRQASGEGLAENVLIRPLHQKQTHSEPNQDDIRAASTVLKGMRMVMQRPEPGWKDSGTMASHVERQFSQPCQDDCGIWGKTGTVSNKDTHFAGASLFAGLIQPEVVRQWMKLTPRPKDNKQLHTTLAIGVVAIPEPNSQPFHDAGALGMELARLLSLDI
jgi:hypothetical protein